MTTDSGTRFTLAIRLCPLCKGKKMWCITCRGEKVIKEW